MANDTKKEKPTRPLCLKVEEAKCEIVDAINRAQKSGIPFFMLESIIANVANQVSTYAKAERESAKATYNKQLEEYQKVENPKE